MININILFVTLCPIEVNTSAMIRNNALIKGLILLGHNVDILSKPSHKVNPFYDDSMIWSENINIINLKSNQIYNSVIQEKNNLIGRIKRKLLPKLRYIYHSFSLFDNTIYIAKSADSSILPKNYYDIIISSSDPKSSHYAVQKLVETGLSYGRWVQYWGDPLAIDITKRSVHPLGYVKYKEKQLFSFADKIIYVSPFTLKEQQNMYPDYKSKMSFLPIPYIKEKIYIKQNSSEENFILGYFGDYDSNVRDIVKLYNISDQENYNLIIAGNSDLKLNQLKKISIFPRVSQAKLEELESTCDILVCILNKRGTQIPGKVYHYAATNKPVLVILDGDRKEEMRRYLEGFNRYILCDNDEKSIKSAITSIINADKKYVPSSHFEPTVIAKKVIDLVKE